MIPLIVLLAVFVVALFSIKILRGSYQFAQSGRIAMSAMLVFTAIGHFAFAKGMAMMLPSFIPYKIETVYLTGVLEIAAAVGLLIPGVRVVTGWLLIAFFILILPANIYASINHVDYQKATFDGNGPAYLWFRVPLQVLFIGWVYFAAVKKRSS